MKADYSPPATYLNPERTAARVVAVAGVPEAHFAAMVPQTRSMAHGQAHNQALVGGGVIAAQRMITKGIMLSVEGGPHFCTREDRGIPNQTLGVSIATYRHYDDDLANANQFVWILRIEMTAKARPQSTPRKPGDYSHFRRFA
jgi:hypothetical protein